MVENVCISLPDSVCNQLVTDYPVIDKEELLIALAS